MLIVVVMAVSSKNLMAILSTFLFEYILFSGRSGSVRDLFGICSGSIRANFGPEFSEPNSKISKQIICAAVAATAGAL